MCKSTFRQNSRTFLAHRVLSRGDRRGDAWWRKLERLTQITQLAVKAAVRKVENKVENDNTGPEGRLLAVEACVRAQVTPCGICVKPSGIELFGSPSLLTFIFNLPTPEIVS